MPSKIALLAATALCVAAASTVGATASHLNSAGDSSHSKSESISAPDAAPAAPAAAADEAAVEKKNVEKAPKKKAAKKKEESAADAAKKQQQKEAEAAAKAKEAEAEAKWIKGWAKVPDYTKDPAVAKQLKCASCVAIAYEIHSALKAVNTFRHGEASEYELFETMENSCPRIAKGYGLWYEPSNGKTIKMKRADKDGNIIEVDEDASVYEFRPTDRFPDALIGRWATPMLANRCGRIVDRYDQKILNEFRHYEESGDFVRLMCIEWDKACEKAPTPPPEPEAEKSAAEGEEGYDAAEDDGEMPEVYM